MDFSCLNDQFFSRLIQKLKASVAPFMSEVQEQGQGHVVQSSPYNQQPKAESNKTAEISNNVSQNNRDQSAHTTQNSHIQNKKWQKIISEQAEDESTPFILQQQSFKSQNQKQQLHRQKSIMQQTAKTGRQLLIQQKYQQASKQLSKTLMAFEFIAKNHAQTIQKQILKETMIKTVLPAYNNLALCYLKLKNFQLVASFTNQVLAQDDGNVKARYRRALALKQLKNTDHAIKDFQIVKKLDPQMVNDCDERIKECKLLEIEIRKKRKMAAQKFISGYQSDDIRASSSQESQANKSSNLYKQSKQAQKGFSLLSWIKEKCQKCSKLIRSLRPNSNEQSQKVQ